MGSGFGPLTSPGANPANGFPVGKGAFSKISPMARRTSNSSKTTNLSKMVSASGGGGPVKGVPEMSLKMREEKQRIE